MATKREILADPGSAINKAEDDEELFVLRASDVGWPVILNWIERMASRISPEKCRGAFDVYMRGLRWQNRNPGKTGVPD